jgi:hypothetical protein
MTAADLQAFSRALFEIAVVCGRHRLEDDVAAVYFRQLSDLPREPLLRAMANFAKTAETGRRFPSPREIREWVSSSHAQPRGLTDDETTAVWRRVNPAMDEWERTGKAGSAWPTFEVTWHGALATLGLLRAAKPQDRQDCWQRWLWHGASRREDAPIATRDQVERILRDVEPRCSPLFAKALRDIADRIHAARDAPDRDPGEEG